MVQSFLPVCMRIRHYVLDWLSSTEGSGRKLPSSREIAAKFNVSQPTVVKALQELTREGFLINLPRVGIFSNPDRAGARKRLWGIVLGDGRWSYLTGEAAMVIHRMTADLMWRSSCYRLKIITMGETMDEEEGWPELSMLSGIFWWIPEDAMLPAIGKLSETVPGVVIGKRCPGVPCFRRDYEAENYRIASRMLADGCRKLVLVKPDMEAEAAAAGVVRACREAGADFPAGCVLGSDSGALRDLERMVSLGMTPDGIIFNVPPREYISILNDNPAFSDVLFYCDSVNITSDWKFRGYAGGIDYAAIAPALADCLEQSPRRQGEMEQVMTFDFERVYDNGNFNR